MARLAVLAAALVLGGCATLGLPPRGSVERAERLLEQGRAAEAQAAAREVRAGNPGYARARALAARAAAMRARATGEALARGDALELSGKLFEAIRAYEQGLRADPRHPVLLARAAAAREALARARDRLRLAALRTEVEARLEVEQAWAALAAADPSNREARRRVAKLARARPALAVVHIERAKALRDEGRVREAHLEAELAARLDPGREETRLLVQRLARGAGLFARAADPLASDTRARARERSSEVHADGKEDRRPGSKGSGGAEGTTDQSSKGEAPVASGTGRARSGEAVVREALTLARLAAQRGDYARAMQVLARAEGRAPDAPELAAARAAVQRLIEAEVEERIKGGIARFQREDLEGAIQEWGRALELDPENAVALDYRRKAQGMLKRIEEIREEVRQRGDQPARGP